MEAAQFVFAFGSFVSGLYAARLWLLASRVNFRPFVEINGRIVELPPHDLPAWLNAIRMTIDRSGEQNSDAAKWSAVSVGLAAISSFLSFGVT